MVLTPERFVKTEFGLLVGILLVGLALISIMRGTSSGKKRSPTGTIMALGAAVVGGYIIAKFYGYDF